MGVLITRHPHQHWMLSGDSFVHSFGVVLCFKVTKKIHPFFRGKLLLPVTGASCPSEPYTQVSCASAMCWQMFNKRNVGGGGVESPDWQYWPVLGYDYSSKKDSKLPTRNTKLGRNVHTGLLGALLPGINVWYFTVTINRKEPPFSNDNDCMNVL